MRAVVDERVRPPRPRLGRGNRASSRTGLYSSGSARKVSAAKSSSSPHVRTPCTWHPTSRSAAPSTRPSLESARASHARRPAKSKGGGGGGASSSATLGAARGAVAADPRVVRSVPLISMRSNAPPARQGRVAQPARAPHPNPSRQPNGRSRVRVRRVLGALTAGRAARQNLHTVARQFRAQPEESRRDAFVSYYRARLDVASPRLACLVSALRSIHVSPLAPSVVGVTRCVSRQRPGTLSTPSRRPGANPSPPVADSGGYKSPPRNPPGVPWPPRPRARSSCCRFRTPS